MITYLKCGKTADEVAEADIKVRQTVENILADIERRGDDAVRELAKKFDGHICENFRLSDNEIQTAIAQVPAEDLDDIKFAQAQVRNFAEKQKECLQDLEVETPVQLLTLKMAVVVVCLLTVLHLVLLIGNAMTVLQISVKIHMLV